MMGDLRRSLGGRTGMIDDLLRSQNAQWDEPGQPGAAVRNTGV